MNRIRAGKFLWATSLHPRTPPWRKEQTSSRQLKTAGPRGHSQGLGWPGPACHPQSGLTSGRGQRAASCAREGRRCGGRRRPHSPAVQGSDPHGHLDRCHGSAGSAQAPTAPGWAPPTSPGPPRTPGPPASGGGPTCLATEHAQNAGHHVMQRRAEPPNLRRRPGLGAGPARAEGGTGLARLRAGLGLTGLEEGSEWA